MTSATNHIGLQQAGTEIEGIRMNLILSAECTGGKLTIIEQEIGIGAVSSAHVCNREDKVILVTKGNFLLFAEGKTYEAEKGANIFIPHGIVHSIKNIGTQTGVLLVTLTPDSQPSAFKPSGRSVKVFGKNNAVMHNVAKKYDVVIS